MTIITTRRHPFKFYAVLAFSFLFIFALGSLFMFASIQTLQEDQPAAKDYFMPVFSLALFFLAFLMVYAYWKNSPQVIIEGHSIKIGDETISLKSIQKVVLTGKMPFSFIIQIPMEGTRLILNDGSERIIFDDMYSNSSEVKLFLQQVVINKQQYRPALSSNISKDSIRLTSQEIFKGNQFTSLRGISLWGVFGLFAFMTVSKQQSLPTGVLIFVGAFGTFWFIFNSWLMHYFGLTKEYLIIKNHNFVWKEIIYRVSDIQEVVFETQPKQPNCMRIITKDFKNKVYPAATLRDKTWLELKAKLEYRGITVRNECI